MTLTTAPAPCHLEFTREEGQRFVKAAKFTASFASTDYARPVITTVAIRAEGNEIEMVATNSYMLGFTKTSFIMDRELPLTEFLVDAKALAGALPTVTKVEQGMSVVLGDGLTISNGLTTHINQEEGNYPNWRSLMSPWTEGDHGSLWCANPKYMAQIFKAFATARGTKDETAVEVIPGGPPKQGSHILKPIGFEMPMEMCTFKGLLMPVRRTS